MSDPGAVVARFISEQPASLTREALEREAPGYLPGLAAWGEGWRVLCAELGMPCPPALVLLGDAMADRHLYLSFAGHAYSMLTPDEARETRTFLLGLARRYPEFARHAAMLPVFGQDGDLLVLAPEGAVYAFVHDDDQDHAPVAASLEDVLERSRPGVVNL